MSKEITVEQYAEIMKGHLDKYVQHWRKMQQEDPENWPELYPEEEWAEQFIAHWTGDIY